QQTRGELETSQTQLQQTRSELEQYHDKQLKMKEELVRLSLERSLTHHEKTREEVESQFLVWKAWNSYTMGQYEKMMGNLRQAWKLQSDSPSEAILSWLGSFEKFSAENNIPFNSEMLTNLPEWQKLMKRVMANKQFIDHNTSSEKLLV
ncbi:MAG: chromosome partitioning protein ParA, partial [Limnospira sp.]